MYGEAAAYRRVCVGPWVLRDDFNVTRYIDERKNGTSTSTAMFDFSKFIDDLELNDPPLLGVFKSGLGDALLLEYTGLCYLLNETKISGVLDNQCSQNKFQIILQLLYIVVIRKMLNHISNLKIGGWGPRDSRKR